MAKTPDRPFAVYTDGEFYADFRTEADRDAALADARAYGDVTVSRWDPDGPRGPGWTEAEPGPQRPKEATADERLAAIAARVSPCPAPDVSQGMDQCAHGTWPCDQTEVAWLARGTGRETEMTKVRARWQADCAEQDAYWEMEREKEDAAREGRDPWWVAEMKAEGAEQEAEAGQ
jgi:hypothetical protein